MDPVLGPIICRNQFHIDLSHPPPRPFRLDGQTQRVGSEIQLEAYYIGFPMTVVQASIHLLSSQSLSHLLLGRFLFNLMSSPLGPLGPKFLTLHSASLFPTPYL
jgi:hypothetical protein